MPILPHFLCISFLPSPLDTHQRPTLTFEIWLGDAKAAFLLFFTETIERKEGTGSETRRSSDFLFLREAGASPSAALKHGFVQHTHKVQRIVESQSESVSSAETTMACKATGAAALCMYAQEDKLIINAYLDMTHSYQIGRS